MNSVGELASGIWDDLGEPDSPSITSISGWLGSARGIGKLNVLLDIDVCIDKSGINAGNTYCYCGTEYQYQSGDFYPALSSQEESIYASIYLTDYYEKQIRDALNGLIISSVSSVSAMDWSELREGDTSIKRSNKNEVAKVYRGLLSDTKSQLNRMVDAYHSNKLDPMQVAGSDG